MMCVWLFTTTTSNTTSTTTTTSSNAAAAAATTTTTTAFSLLGESELLLGSVISSHSFFYLKFLAIIHIISLVFLMLKFWPLSS